MPYYLDLRKKIVSAYTAGKTSIRKVAKQFMVNQKTGWSSNTQSPATEGSGADRHVRTLAVAHRTPWCHQIDLHDAAIAKRSEQLSRLLLGEFILEQGVHGA